MSSKINPQSLTPAFPTFPVQNQFGQPVMFTGLVKLEIIALQMLGHTLPHFENPADAMREAIQMGEMFLTEMDKHIEAGTKDNNTLIIEK